MGVEEDIEKRPLNLKYWEKIDMWSTLLMPLHVWMTIMIISTVTANYAYFDVPNEMLVHYTITINTNETERANSKNVICNPHFKTFKENYITNETLSFTKIRSEEFLVRPEVAAHVNDLYSVNNRTRSILYVNSGGICEVVPNSLDRLGCFGFAEIMAQCHGGACFDTDLGINYCWWGQAGMLYAVLLTEFITYFMGAWQFWSLMYDPPPACLYHCVRPWLSGIFLAISGICSWIAVFIEALTLKKYGQMPVFYREFPGYVAVNDNAWNVALFAAIVQTLSCVLYFTVSIFTPKYPRQPRRWAIRTSNFNRSLRHIKEKALSQLT